MINKPTKSQLNKIPKPNETEGIPLKEKTIHCHFLLFGDSHWFVAEYDGKETFFGFVILNGDLEMAEWGYIFYDELKTLNIGGYEVLYNHTWQPKKASEIKLICDAQGWKEPKRVNKSNLNTDKAQNKCQSCGQIFIKTHTPETYLEGNCFDCSFWLKKIHLPSDEKDRRVIFNGSHYMIGANNSGPFKGFGGKEFMIHFHDGRKIKTDSLWSQGKIPQRFRKELPDNACILPL